MGGATDGSEEKQAGDLSPAPLPAPLGAPGLPDWGALLRAAGSVVTSEIHAETFIKAWPSASKPVAVNCSDGHTYVIKGSNAGRQAVNDCIAAKLAALIGAPVPPSALVAIPEELRQATPEMAHLAPGKAHGSRVMEDCSEREAYAHIDDGDNRRRFASIAILYGWLLANDRQFIYGKAKPNTVYSVDHGHFFPGGPEWNAAGLASAPAALADPDTIAGCGLAEEDLREACSSLESVTAGQIAAAIAAVPAGWAISFDERIALCDYLERRRTDLVKAYPIPNTEPGETK
jgi:hypothetical protein